MLVTELYGTKIPRVRFVNVESVRELCCTLLLQVPVGGGDIMRFVGTRSIFLADWVTRFIQAESLQPGTSASRRFE